MTQTPPAPFSGATDALLAVIGGLQRHRTVFPAPHKLEVTITAGPDYAALISPALRAHNTAHAQLEWRQQIQNLKKTAQHLAGFGEAWGHPNLLVHLSYAPHATQPSYSLHWGRDGESLSPTAMESRTTSSFLDALQARLTIVAQGPTGTDLWDAPAPFGKTRTIPADSAQSALMGANALWWGCTNLGILTQQPTPPSPRHTMTDTFHSRHWHEGAAFFNALTTAARVVATHAPPNKRGSTVGRIALIPNIHPTGYTHIENDVHLPIGKVATAHTTLPVTYFVQQMRTRAKAIVQQAAALPGLRPHALTFTLNISVVGGVDEFLSGGGTIGLVHHERQTRAKRAKPPCIDALHTLLGHIDTLCDHAPGPDARAWIALQRAGTKGERMDTFTGPYLANSAESARTIAPIIARRADTNPADLYLMEGPRDGALALPHLLFV